MILFTVCTHSTVGAEEVTLDMLADTYIDRTSQISNATETITYSNLQEFYAKAYETFPSMNSIDLASFTNSYTGWYVSGESEDELLEILSFESISSSTQVLYVTEDGNMAAMTVSDALNALNDQSISPYAIYSSEDGYIQIQLTSGAVAANVNGETTCVISASFKWLKIPVFELKDTFAVVYGDAVYDDSYSITCTFNETSTCTSCGTTDKLSEKETYLNELTTSSSFIAIDFSQDNAIGARYNLTDQACTHIVNSEASDYSTTRSIEGTLKFRLIVKSTTNAKAAYAHAQVSGVVTISGDYSDGSLSIEFGGSILSKSTKYVGPAITLSA